MVKVLFRGPGGRAGRAAAVLAAGLLALLLALGGREGPAPSAAQTAPAAPRAALGMGLAGLSDWSTQHPFLDLVKSARSWTGHLPGRWGDWDHARLAAGGWLDEAGWLRAMPPELESVELLILTAQPAAATDLAARYRLTYAGRGVIRLRHDARAVETRPGEIWFDYAPGNDGLVGIAIEATDPADPIRDISVVREDHLPLHEAGEIFNPAFLARLDRLALLRFMDWMDTSHTRISAWAERPRPQDYTYTWRGAPLEVMVALANRIGADPWFTLPHLADDDYMRRFAEEVRAGLDPGLRAHVEFSNEVWNWIYPQAHWAHEQGQARWGAEVGDAWVQYYGMRAAQMARIWREVYGAEAQARLVTVIATQSGWTGLEVPILTAPLWVAEDPARNRPPAEYFDAYAVTGYFDGALGRDETPERVLEWLEESRAAAEAAGRAQGLAGAALAAHLAAHRFDRAVELAEAQLRSGAVTGDPEGSLDQLLGLLFPYHAGVARAQGLELIMYEGGTHVVGVGDWTGNDALTEFFIHLNYTEAMGRLYDELLRGWTEAGGTVFTAFHDVSMPSRWGSWGALRHLQDDTPRWRALMRFRDASEAWR